VSVSRVVVLGDSLGWYISSVDDYDSPVSEAGEHGYHSGTDKYAAMQTVLKKYASPAEAIPPEPPLPARSAYGDVKMTSVASLLSNLKVLAPTAAATATSTTPAAETLGPACHYGMILYSKTLTTSDLLDLDAAGSAGLTISAGGLRDRAQIFVDGIEMGTVSPLIAAHRTVLRWGVAFVVAPSCFPQPGAISRVALRPTC
jgi:hypothetical protein